MNRRYFLQYSSLIPLASVVPSAFANTQKGQRPKQIVVMVELKGGNDGLNTLIPFRDGNYFRARPSIAVRNGIPLKNNMAMNPYLKQLMPLWQEGKMAWIQGVGYSNPSRSHFHSIDIWEMPNFTIVSVVNKWSDSDEHPLHFKTYIDGKSQHLVSYSFDDQLLNSMAMLYDGNNSQFPTFEHRMLDMSKKYQ